MFRVTTRTTVDELVITLEGSLIGPWVRELDTCWRDALQELGDRRVQVDLTAVCHVDAKGRELISAMYRGGARFVASGCLMPEVLREITEATRAFELCGERS